ncbi:MAG: NADH-quinone oxidoreductase subunit C [Candidatus Izimaplasma bacterium HR2]|nr:MAG: NADH-quinone oxidoreductase subunit C [Candidatus Izimaplasma bacterium HR2]
MTNSMSNTEFVTNLVESKFKVLSTEVLDKYQVSFEVKKEDVHSLLSLLKTSGWIQLSYLSAVDWPNDNEFELVYIVFNWDKAVHIQIRCRLDRETASMNSILPIFPGCKYYEREAHEFFGIKFPGNPDHEKQLILEEWDDIPPLRKDFDPRAYSDRKFSKMEYKNDFVNKNGEVSKQDARTKRYDDIDKLRTGGKK